MATSQEVAAVAAPAKAREVAQAPDRMVAGPAPAKGLRIEMAGPAAKAMAGAKVAKRTVAKQEERAGEDRANDALCTDVPEPQFANFGQFLNEIAMAEPNT